MKYRIDKTIARLTEELLSRETIIVFNEAEPFVNIFTYNTRLKRKLNSFTEKYPHLAWQTKNDGRGGKGYAVMKDSFKINFKGSENNETK